MGGGVNLLAIETATDAVGVAVLRGDGGAVERIHLGGRAHAERLAPMIDAACAASGLPLSELDVVAVDVGPGLFTGLRVGVATAKALAQAAGLGVVGVGSLDALAAAGAGLVRADATSAVDTVVAVVDARRGEVFAAAYDVGRARVGPTTPSPREGGAGHPVLDVAPASDDRPAPLPPDALVEWLSGLGSGPSSVLVVGDGAVRYVDRLTTLPQLDLGHAASLTFPPPSAVAGLAAARLGGGAGAVDPGILVPDYRRPADARINWEQRKPRFEEGSAKPAEHGGRPEERTP